jgi:hypothetical protein
MGGGLTACARGLTAHLYFEGGLTTWARGLTASICSGCSRITCKTPSVTLAAIMFYNTSAVYSTVYLGLKFNFNFTSFLVEYYLNQVIYHL